ncbi:MAG: caspase family protein [Rhodoplanes sp.]|uniref:caspase family protein n=1 Tax=Rhodoplanes sp. TaxID=1968906 RepID=UPI0017A1849A|nr:caspase family protein [Rhodoplanes sp.]NVO14374.1 caspase family protein [Rhodoplanes sp.]
MRQLMLAVVAALVLLMAAGPADSAEKRVAFIVGNSAYQHAPTLKNPRNDATDMRAKLVSLGFEVFGGDDFDRAAFVSAMQAFGRASENADVALVFYAGHGIQVNGQNYLVPTDAKVEYEPELSLVLVPFDEVMRQLNRSARVKIAILDACRDNPFAKDLSRTMGTRSIDALGRGLGRVQTVSGTFIVYATQPDNVAQDGEGRNSPFTGSLLRHIDQPLSISDMIIEVRNEVIGETRGKQVPWDSSSLTGRFSFKIEGTITVTPQGGAPSVGAQPPADPRLPDMMAWIAAQGSTDPQDFETYLKGFPDGLYARQARQRIEALRRTPVPDVQARAPSEPQAPGRPDPAAAERERWVRFANSTNPEHLASFLRDYPDGPYAGEAANNLGSLYFNGTGTPRNLRLAAEMFERGQKLGSSHAANNLGNMYATGMGVPKDDARALALYRRGAELGHPDAMTNVGAMLAGGRGAPRDDAQAIAWFRRANNANGIMNVALMIDRGHGASYDPAEAASLLLECLRLGQIVCHNRLIDERGKVITLETRRAIQRLLAGRGSYRGPIDGTFGPTVIQALQAIAKG